MTEIRYYEVGGHQFCLEAAEGLQILDYLQNCHPFEILKADACVQTDMVFDLKIEESFQQLDPKGKFVVQFDGEGAYINMYENEEGTCSFAITTDGKDKSVMAILTMTDCSNKALLTLVSNLHVGTKLYVVNNALMLLYALTTACRDTLLVHASVVSCQGKGYMFLGRSGTGKSTHSRLWLEHIADTHLLNDDNPVIRLFPDGAVVYGTPWSGKTPCYRNESIPLGAIVRLSQYPENKIEHLQGVKAYAAVAPSASAMRWKRKYADGLHSTLSKLVSTLDVYHLLCCPNKEAARLCHDTITR